MDRTRLCPRTGDWLGVGPVPRRLDPGHPFRRASHDAPGAAFPRNHPEAALRLRTAARGSTRVLLLPTYPAFQIVFGVQDMADAALTVAQRLRDRFPRCDIAIVVSCTDSAGR